MSYLIIDKVTKKFDGTVVLNEISLAVERGELVTLLGPSGCGKSTLLRCIAGLNEVDGGRILLNDRDITYLAPRKRGVGMVFQSYALFPNMTVYENVAFGLKMQGLKGDRIAARVREMIDLVGLAGKEGSYPRELSGGQQQRVALARSMIVEPDVLLLDEPFNALDAKIRKTLQMELKNIQKKSGMTMIFVTHDQEEALTISDRIFVINEGRVAQSGKPLEIYSQPANEFVARFIGNFNVLKGEEFEQLVGEPLFPGKSLAIRPEVIKLSLNGENGKGHNGSWRIKGKVVGVFLKGNILRYRVRSKGSILDVDVLNNSMDCSLNYDTWVDLVIPKDEVKVLNL